MSCPFASRRGFLAGATLAGGLIAGMPVARAARPDAGAPSAEPGREPFWGAHQGGIVTPPQTHTYFAAFDLVANHVAEVRALLRAWTQAAGRLALGDTAAPLGADLTVAAADSGEAIGLPPARLTLTFGLGAGLFVRDGHDRYGLAAQRPAALVDMPGFNGDQLVPERSGGDLSVQACADDPQVAFHAVRQLARMADGIAAIRWAQTGFLAGVPAGQTPRNLMGFKDGTQTLLGRGAAGPVRSGADTHSTDATAAGSVWVGEEGPSWMRGGSYLVVRRIRMALEHWDRTDTAFQEQVIGRHKHSGAPLGGVDEFDPLDLAAADADGNPVIPDDAHVRLAAAASNDGAQMLRRGYSYNDGANFTAERWPPWRQGIELDAGLFFVAYQRDPRTAFIPVNARLAALDALNQYTTHTGSGLFACPAGPRPGGFLGDGLFSDI